MSDEFAEPEDGLLLCADPAQSIGELHDVLPPGLWCTVVVDGVPWRMKRLEIEAPEAQSASGGPGTAQTSTSHPKVTIDRCC